MRGLWWLLPAVFSVLCAGHEAKAQDRSDGDRTWRLKGLMVPVDLAGMREELGAELATFEETGIVSVESGAACLDAASGEGQGGPGDSISPPQVEFVPAALRIQVQIPVPQSPAE